MPCLAKTQFIHLHGLAISVREQALPAGKALGVLVTSGRLQEDLVLSASIGCLLQTDDIFNRFEILTSC